MGPHDAPREQAIEVLGSLCEDDLVCCAHVLEVESFAADVFGRIEISIVWRVRHASSVLILSSQRFYTSDVFGGSRA